METNLFDGLVQLPMRCSYLPPIMFVSIHEIMKLHAPLIIAVNNDLGEMASLIQSIGHLNLICTAIRIIQKVMEQQLK